MKKRKIIACCLVVLLFGGCNNKKEIEIVSDCDVECKIVTIKSSNYNGIVIYGKDRTRESNSEILVDNSLDSRLFGIWIDEGEKTGTTGIIYIFFSDGTFFESFRFPYGQGQIYAGTYRTEGNIVYLTTAGSEEGKYYFEIDEIEGVLRMKYETWETREYIMKKITEK